MCTGTPKEISEFNVLKETIVSAMDAGSGVAFTSALETGMKKNINLSQMAREVAEERDSSFEDVVGSFLSAIEQEVAATYTHTDEAHAFA